MNKTMKNLEILAAFFNALLVSSIPMEQKILFRDCNTTEEIQAVIEPMLEAEYSPELDWLYSITRPVETTFYINVFVICEN
jgi:hypothetical protein